MKTHSVVYINDWSDSSVAAIRDDVMLPIGKGIYFHHRLQLLIVVKDEVQEWSEVTNYLP